MVTDGKNGKIEKKVFEGPGKIIIARRVGELYYSSLTQVGPKWQLAVALGENYDYAFEDSIIAAFKTAYKKKMTTSAFCRFLSLFELPLQSVFDNDQNGTSRFIFDVCATMTSGYHHKENLSEHSIRNLEDWLSALKPGPADPVRAELRRTIDRLKKLPQKPPKSDPLADLARAAAKT